MRLGVVAMDHIAIAVRSVSAALPLYRDLLGGSELRTGVNEAQGYRAVRLRYPNGAELELLEPVGAGFLRDFLTKRGEGLHHLTYIVSDLRAAVRAAREAGLRVVDESYENPGWFEAFISPRSAHGTIVQLAQTTLARSEGVRCFTERHGGDR